MGGKMPMRIRVVAAASGGAYDYVSTDRVPPGELWAIQGHAFENVTGARSTARAYIDGGGDDTFLWEELTVPAGELFWSEKTIFLRPGERLTVRQATCTAADKLWLYAHGYKVFGKYLPGDGGED